MEAFRDLWVLIAGCGSGGGQVALQLVMSGVRKFILVDMDKLEIENVIRHVCDCGTWLAQDGCGH